MRSSTSSTAATAVRQNLTHGTHFHWITSWITFLSCFAATRSCALLILSRSKSHISIFTARLSFLIVPLTYATHGCIVHDEVFWRTSTVDDLVGFTMKPAHDEWFLHCSLMHLDGILLLNKLTLWISAFTRYDLSTSWQRVGVFDDTLVCKCWKYSYLYLAYSGFSTLHLILYLIRAEKWCLLLSFILEMRDR